MSKHVKAHRSAAKSSAGKKENGPKNCTTVHTASELGPKEPVSTNLKMNSTPLQGLIGDEDVSFTDSSSKTRESECGRMASAMVASGQPRACPISGLRCDVTLENGHIFPKRWITVDNCRAELLGFLPPKYERPEVLTELLNGPCNRLCLEGAVHRYFDGNYFCFKPTQQVGAYVVDTRPILDEAVQKTMEFYGITRGKVVKFAVEAIEHGLLHWRYSRWKAGLPTGGEDASSSSSEGDAEETAREEAELRRATEGRIQEFLHGLPSFAIRAR